MLKIKKEKDGNTLALKLDGRLDTLTAPELEKELVSSMEDVTNVILDFKDLEYISSAGLRVLLNLEQTMEDKGELKVLHVNDEIMEVFEITGFSEMLDIER